MPLTYQRDFCVRHYECDAFGRAHADNFFRYMQESAFDASSAAGHDMQRYEEIGHHWLIRASSIEYLQPLCYKDRFQVTTWISDFRRATSRRQYRFERDGKCFARACSDWVYLDSRSGRPASIPEEMQRAFFPDGIPDSFPPRERLTEPPPPPSGAYVSNRRVAFHDLDMVHHVNNAVYVQYAGDCSFEFTAAHGWPIQRMHDEGFSFVLREQQVHYRQPALLDDELEISTWLSNLRPASADQYFLVKRVSDGELLVQIRARAVCIDLKTGRPRRIPQELLEGFVNSIS